jgi:large subunit ribosomal protein L30
MSSKVKATKKQTKSKSSKKLTKASSKKVIEKPVEGEVSTKKNKRKNIEKKEQTICVIRIRGALGMRRTIQNTLHLFKLYRVNHATLVRDNPSVRGMLHKAKDYIAFGPVDAEHIKKLLKKRSLLVGNKPLTDNHVRFATVYKSIDDLAKALFEGKIRMKEVKDLKPIFKLHPPIGGHKGSIKKAYNAGGVLGNVGENINGYLKKMM